ncbi:MAG: acylphosphatase [Anaerolineae bacterium]
MSTEANELMTDQRLHAVVHGRVQGVNFRYYTVRKANELGLKGWVRNRWDGTVEALAEGPRTSLDRFVSWLRQGPSSASVVQVDVTWAEATGEFGDFRVTYTAS